jgi:hypothetical protein
MKCSMSSNQNQHYINDAIELLWQYGSYSRKRHSKLTQCQFIIEDKLQEVIITFN